MKTFFGVFFSIPAAVRFVWWIFFLGLMIGIYLGAKVS
ncbi:hypothetical protein SAMN05444157_3476 [Frankineae bacterium MT45]|nr:hypothetical protein SAMN05444157_3476 [Frankineae bacterium MT45]